MMVTALTESWGLNTPIVQAPMAGVSGGALAFALSRAGGLGMIGASNATSADWLAEQAKTARAGGKFGVGLLAWAVDFRPELLEVAIEQRPFAISMAFGNVARYGNRVKEAGIKLIVQVQDGALARSALELQPDAIVAQGTEAGGHSGAVGTLPLLQLVLDLVGPTRIPVLAAGGIATGRGIAGVLAMGAAGAWIGTRFAAAEEALGPAAAKQRIVDALETDTLRTHVFDIVQGAAWPNDFPGRALANAFTARWHGREAELEARLDEVASEFEAARQRGDYGEAHVYAGQAVGLIRDVRPAAEILRELSSEAERTLEESLADVLRSQPVSA